MAEQRRMVPLWELAPSALKRVAVRWWYVLKRAKTPSQFGAAELPGAEADEEWVDPDEVDEAMPAGIEAEDPLNLLAESDLVPADAQFSLVAPPELLEWLDAAETGDDDDDDDDDDDGGATGAAEPEAPSPTEAKPTDGPADGAPKVAAYVREPARGPELEAKIRRLRAEGYGLRAVAKMVGMVRNTLTRYMVARGMPTGPVRDELRGVGAHGRRVLAVVRGQPGLTTRYVMLHAHPRGEDLFCERGTPEHAAAAVETLKYLLRLQARGLVEMRPKKGQVRPSRWFACKLRSEDGGQEAERSVLPLLEGKSDVLRLFGGEPDAGADMQEVHDPAEEVPGPPDGL